MSRRLAAITSLALLVPLIPTASALAEKRPVSPGGGIQFSHVRGFYTEPIKVAISGGGPEAQIYYSTNGTIPSKTSGQIYTGPIRLASTTILRAAAFYGPAASPKIETQTYLFLKSVLRQRGENFPATWGTNQGKPVPADYEMDPEIVNHPSYRDKIEEALKSIPSLSVALDPADLFDPLQGLYAHPTDKGSETERAASVEWISPGDGGGFQVDCGLRIQGGWNRRPEESPKHSFRLLFKKKYGPARLKFPLFGGGVREFETVTLRAGCNNTWLHWSSEERRRGDFIRDQWMRDTLRAMGHLSARGVFVHLYLNGLYWGLYNVTERPGAPFVAAHLGGSAKDFDSRNGEKILEGDATAWNRMFALANAGLSGNAEYQAMEELLDIPDLIDFMIANLYGANSDWDHVSNWYAARRRQPSGKFQFFVWDAERILEGVEANAISFDDDQSPPRLFQKLRANPEFRLQFADRVHRHLFDGGALAPGLAAERFRIWSKQIDSAVIAESARWGDYRRDAHPYKTGPYELYTRDDHWLPEIDRLLKDYFPKRTDVALRQFREAGLYPKLDAPTAQTSGNTIVLKAAAGTIYFTQDGNDPRLRGGGISPSAIKYEGPVALNDSRKLKARALSGAPDSSGWSALLDFSAVESRLRPGD